MPLNRRQALRRLSATLGTAGGSTLAAACQQRPARADAVRGDWALGYRSVDQERYQARVAIEGDWPRTLDGAFYRNGPALHDIGDFRYRHWFDGDGLVQRFAAGEGRLSHQAALVQTAKRRQERALGRAALPAFGTVPPNGVGVTSADDLNPANISVLAHHERLFALWEAGSPHELDPDTLETRGVTEFSDDAAGLPFSAHPKVEADGTLWNFGYSGGELLVLWHLDSTGRVKRLKPLRIENVGMPHDFVVTERYLVFLLAPLHRNPDADLETASFLDLHRWYPDRATRVVIVRKSDLELEQVVELPAQWVFHFGNAYDDGRGIVRFDAARSPSPEILTQSFRSVMAGHWHVPPAVRWTEYRVDLNARRADESLLLDDLECEFPRIDPRQVARHHDHVWMLAGTPGQASPGGLNQVLRIDRRSDTVDRYVYGPEYMVEEHTVVTPTASKQRFLLGTALNLEQRRTELHLFDADALAAGPRARAVLPYAMPLGFHGTYRESPRA